MPWLAGEAGAPGASMKLERLEVVARDGLEPPTPAFSGPARTIVILLIPFGLSISCALKTAILLEWNWNGFWNGQLHQSVHDFSLRLWNELLVEIQRRACSGMPH